MTSRSHIIASVSDHILLQFEGPHNPHIDSLLSQQSFDPKKIQTEKHIYAGENAKKDKVITSTSLTKGN
jgi:hypothetical protein